MINQFCGLFNLSEKLSSALSIIISKEENGNFICTPITITVPEHIGPVFVHNSDSSYGGNKEKIYLDDGNIHDLSYMEGKCIQEYVPEKNFNFFVIIDITIYNALPNIKFKSGIDIKNVLDVVCGHYFEYFSVFDPRVLYEKYPYLYEFFFELNKWRELNNTFELNDSIIDECTSKFLSSQKKK